MYEPVACLESNSGSEQVLPGPGFLLSRTGQALFPAQRTEIVRLFRAGPLPFTPGPLLESKRQNSPRGSNLHPGRNGAQVRMRIAQEALGSGKINTGIGDRDSVFQILQVIRDLLISFEQMAFQHDAYELIVS